MEVIKIIKCKLKAFNRALTIPQIFEKIRENNKDILRVRNLGRE